MTPLPKEYRTQFEYLEAAVRACDSDECLLWPFHKDAAGYGILRVPASANNGHGKNAGAHRASFLVAHGRWPDPCGLHKCDNPPCFNPRHIWEGTCGDNNQDRIAKGRSVIGSQNPISKLTEDQVEQARKEYRTGMFSIQTLGSKYGVSRLTMSDALKGTISWKHVPGALGKTKIVIKVRAERKKKTYCHRGHLLAGDNVAVYGCHRQCKECWKINSKARWERIRKRRSR